ncbi:hypothetical protein JCM8097_001593 [Rhodosporidiobolus ruineniae]
MSVPALPFDVIELVFDHLSLLDEPDRREVAKPLALVCHDWLPLARRLAWSTVSIVAIRDERVLRHLCEHERLREFVKKLRLVGQKSLLHLHKPEDLPEHMRDIPKDAVLPFISTETHARNFAAVLVRLPELTDLAVCDTTSLVTDLLQAASVSPSRTKLEHLRLVHRFDEDDRIRAFLDALAQFPHLHLLDLQVHFRDDAYEPEEAKATVLRLPLSTLSLDLLDSPDAFRTALTRALDAALEPEKLRILRIEGPSADTVLFDALSECINLMHVEFFSVETDAIEPLFSSLCTALPHLTSLVILTFTSDEDGSNLNLPNAVNSPVGLPVFLEALAPSVQMVKVGGILFLFDFVDNDFPTIAFDNVSETVPTVLVVSRSAADDANGDEDGSETMTEGEGVRQVNVAFAKLEAEGEAGEHWVLVLPRGMCCGSSCSSEEDEDDEEPIEGGSGTAVAERA